MLTRTCPDCLTAEDFDPTSYPDSRCSNRECDHRWCPYCHTKAATRRWVPLGCQGTRFHVTVCGECYVKQSEADKLAPAERGR